MRLETKRFIYSGVLAILTLAIPILLSSSKVALMTALMIITSIAMCMIKPTKTHLLVFIISFVLGTLSEIIAINYGLWSYQSVFFKGIPIYLPFVWGNAGLYISSLHDFIKQYEN